MRQPQKSNDKALASLVFGVLGLLCLVPIISPVIAIITGHASRRAVRNSGGTLGGGGMAMAGLLMGYLGLALPFLAGLALPLLESGRQATRWRMTEGHSGIIYQSIGAYAAKHEGRLPDGLDVLAQEGYLELSRVWLQPGTTLPLPQNPADLRRGGTDFVYSGKGLTLQREDAAEVVILHVKLIDGDPNADHGDEQMWGLRFLDGQYRTAKGRAIQLALATGPWKLGSDLPAEKAPAPPPVAKPTPELAKPAPVVPKPSVVEAEPEPEPEPVAKPAPEPVAVTEPEPEPETEPEEEKPAAVTTSKRPSLLVTTEEDPTSTTDDTPAKSEPTGQRGIPMLPEATTFELNGKLLDVTYNSRYMLLRLDDGPVFYLFDLKAGAWAGKLDSNLTDGMIAMNKESAYIAYNNRIERHDLETRKRTHSAALKDNTFLAIGAGYATTNSTPIVVQLRKNLFLLNAKTLKDDQRALAAEQHFYSAKAMPLVISPKGTYACFWNLHVSPRGLHLFDLADPKAKGAIYQHTTVGYQIPDDQGRVFTGENGIYVKRGDKLEGTGMDQFKRHVIVPSIGEKPVLMLDSAINKDDPWVQVHRWDKDGSLIPGPTFHGLDEMQRQKERRHDQQQDKSKPNVMEWQDRVLFFQDISTLVTLPFSNDRLVLRRLTAADIKHAQDIERGRAQ